MWITTFFIKSIHELGHGLTCKHFGGEVHEVGVMSLVFTPYFFVNVSDCWVMPNRMHRMLVSAAGIYVELILAAFATFLWAVVQPGPMAIRRDAHRSTPCRSSALRLSNTIRISATQ